MACCRNVMLLDTAGGAAGQSQVRRVALRLLIYLSCRFGLARVRWAFRFFDSQGARSRPSRFSDFRELGARSWEDFEEELEARLGDGAPGAHLPGPAPRATHTHSALLETLLDYQWDRPEITSPTKPILRSSGRRLVDVESEAKEAETALGGFGNAVFLLAPCPHSQRELLQFVSACEAQAQRLPPTPKQVMEKVLPKRVEEVLIARKITLYWVDTTERAKVWDSPDHRGYWTVRELLHRVGGTILPAEIFSQHRTKAGGTPLSSDTKVSGEPHLSSWISTLPADSTLNCLLYNSPEYEASFPRMEGTLFLPVEGKEIQETWAVTLVPLTMHQRHFQKPVRIFLKGTATQWSLPMSGTVGTDSWMLQSPDEDKSTQRTLFEQLLNRLIAEELHLVASVDPGEGWPPVTGVISPLSTNNTVLTVFCSEEAEFPRHFLHTAVAEDPPGAACLFSDVLDVVLNQTHDLLEDPAASAPPVPEWAQRELGRESPGSAAVEQWFPRSNLSGASSELMESFGLLQAASSGKEESSKTESELTRCLSELYLRKSREEPALSNQEDSKKNVCVPRTPMRQKMNTMCRSLKMLNVARLNVRAQKSHPDGSPDTTGEKGIQKTAVEEQPRLLRSSKLALLSYIHENYQKSVATGETVLYSSAQNMISTIKAFLKSKGTKELEMNCLNQVRNNLLKTSKSLRQNVGEKLDKEDKVRECQLQVFLRLEMCLQCPSMHDSIDDTERVVEEVSDLLRMVCLTEDSAYLAKFLEEILELLDWAPDCSMCNQSSTGTIDSIPKTLGNLYHSLGFEIPQKLVGVLPTDFLSDDSMTQESKSPLLSEPRRSVSGATESEQLEELRTRSATKRRKNALIRHKSITEVSQNLRQIEIPKVSKRATKNGSSRPTLQQPPAPVKDTVQEVTKVRRNLFEEMSPSKRSVKRGLPRSHSVSTVEGLEYKLDNCQRTKGTFQSYHHTLLTKSVAETPVHKQISRRLLHRQIKEIGLRRSPRIKQLLFSRTNSGSFYSVSQQKSRSVQRVHSFQQDKSDQREHSPIQSIQSPKRLLFGAVSEVTSPSEEGSARNKRPSRNTVESQMPTAYQTPKKCYWKSPSSSKATPRRFPHTPRTPSYTLERSPAATTPAKQVLLESPEVSSSHDWNSPSPPKVTPEQGCCVPVGVASVLGKIPTTPRRPHGPSPGFVQNSSQPSLVNSSPENTSCLAVPMASTAQTHGECVTPARYSLRSPSRAAALGKQSETALTCLRPIQTHQHPHVAGASQAKELAQKWKGKAVKTPKKPGDTAVTSPVSSEEPFTSPLCDISKSPLRNSSTEPHSTGELDWEESQKSSSVAPRLSCLAPSSPRKISQTANSDIIPPPPPPTIGRRHGKASYPESCFLERPRLTSVAPGLGVSDTPDARKGQREVNASPQAPASHGDPGPGFRSEWHTASPSPVAGDMECLPLLEEAERHGSDDLHSRVPPMGEGERLGVLVAYKQPSPSNPGLPQSPPACGPSTPPTASYALRCTADRRQRQAAARLRNLDASSQLPEAPGSPQTYEVELEMQASGLPKLRIKKRDTSSGSEAKPLGREALPGLSVPRGSKAETAYVSPPCLHPLHSTPGKSSGQTYICQSCTPTRCPSSTPCPLQTDTGLPWTPSPKHSGKTTPDSIRDWPRRKRAVASAGRGTVSTELSSCVSPLPLEATERDLELGGSKTPILGDFELEGVCRLPDQSPPRDTVPEAEEAISSGQFGLGSRKRHVSAKEEAQCQAKRVCDKQREDSEVCTCEENSPTTKMQQRTPCTGDGGVFISGSPPPSGCAARGCLSASGLQALTQSPLLFHGKTPSSQARDASVDVFPPAAEESPFSRTLSRRRAISRTYTRKKLIT
uniref:TOPBP1 interacting checkpoint and replication regulator n=1 Tax=Rhinolophus ferrumequinum TaxID=59479 RepID=A0A671EKK1_RHIFE